MSVELIRVDEAVRAELAGHEVVLHHGDPAGEYAALRMGAILVDRSHRLRMRVRGEKAADMVTGLVSFLTPELVSAVNPGGDVPGARDDGHLHSGGSDVHLRQRRHLQREGHRDRRVGHLELGDGSGARHQRAEPVQPERQVG